MKAVARLKQMWWHGQDKCGGVNKLVMVAESREIWWHGGLLKIGTEG